MSEPKRYDASLDIPCGLSPTTRADVYLCDDPAYLEMRRKAEALDKLERINNDERGAVLYLGDGEAHILRGGRFKAPSLLEAIEQCEVNIGQG